MIALAKAPTMLIASLFCLNVAAYWLFALDKRRAEAGWRRISERTLLGIALVGGSIGAKLAQCRLRHKTRKEPFRSLLNLICVVQALAFFALLLPVPRAEATALVGRLAPSFGNPFDTAKIVPRRFGPGR